MTKLMLKWEEVFDSRKIRSIKSPVFQMLYYTVIRPVCVGKKGFLGVGAVKRGVFSADRANEFCASK